MKSHGVLVAVLIVVVLVLTLLGGIILYGSLYRTVDYTYWVDVTAPDDVDWSLWIPRPRAATSLETRGAVLSVASIDTTHGTMDNVTGRGTASLGGSSHREVFAPEAGGSYVPEPLELSGTDGSLYWVWRSSSDPAAAMTIFGTVFSKATSYSEEVQCGEAGYGGAVREGWSSFQAGLGDCNALIGFPGGYATSGLLFAAALALVAASLFARRKNRATLRVAESRDTGAPTIRSPGK